MSSKPGAIQSFPDGTQIVGDFKEGSIKKGSIFYPDGDKYEGELKNFEPDGYGIFLFGNGDKYSGEFKDGIKNGKGIYYYRANNKRKGDKYDGEWKDNRFNGYVFTRMQTEINMRVYGKMIDVMAMVFIPL